MVGVIEDASGNGVIHIVASGIEVEFAPGSRLRGAPSDRRPDEPKGYGIRIDGQSNVTIRGASISCFWCGLWATNADGYAVEGTENRTSIRAQVVESAGAIPEELSPVPFRLHAWKLSESSSRVCLLSMDSTIFIAVTVPA